MKNLMPSFNLRSGKHKLAISVQLEIASEISITNFTDAGKESLKASNLDPMRLARPKTSFSPIILEADTD
jgi:hypothetical protein